jgi:hypothetical protein
MAKSAAIKTNLGDVINASIKNNPKPKPKEAAKKK